MRMGLTAAVTAGLVTFGVAPAVGATQATMSTSPGVSTARNISHRCSGQNAEVEQAIDPTLGYVYEEWMGCHNQIAFARSTDGGRRFGRPLVLRGSNGAWDPALAVSPRGVVYAAFMNSSKRHTFPVVEASFNHGRSFPQLRRVVPRKTGNWGDRDFITVAPDGTLYLTWDYGPSAKAVTYICTPGGSCAFATGDLNVVVQKSTDGGRHWGPIIPVSPGFPASGGDSAPLLVEPDGRIDVLYQGYHITSRTKYTMTPAHTYFTSSSDGGRRWSAPVRVGPPNLTMSLAEWWIDGAIGRDAAGNLYATFDTQGRRQDVGWLSYSTDHGKTWSRLLRVTPQHDKAVHIVEVAGGRAGIAYVGWLADDSSHGYAEYLREFSISHGWLSPVIRVSAGYGVKAVWPGDTFGITAFPAIVRHGRVQQRVMLSWGSAVGLRAKPPSEIFAAAVTFRAGASRG